QGGRVRDRIERGRLVDRRHVDHEAPLDRVLTAGRRVAVVGQCDRDRGRRVRGRARQVGHRGEREVSGRGGIGGGDRWRGEQRRVAARDAEAQGLRLPAAGADARQRNRLEAPVLRDRDGRGDRIERGGKVDLVDVDRAGRQGGVRGGRDVGVVERRAVGDGKG